MANEVSIEITVEEKQALKALTKLTKGVDTTTDNVVRGAKRMDMAFASFAGNLAAGAALKGLGLITQGMKAIVSQIGTLTDAASVQEDAINDLNNALVRGGEFSKATSLELQNFASELQRVSKFGDEAILSQMAFAQSMGASGEQSKIVLSAAADMASALNIDLNSAVRNISKTLGGYAGELGEVIPELKNLTAEQLKAGLGIDLLAQKFKGAAESQINTFSGAIEQASNTFGDLQETLGFTITQSPVVIAAIKGLSTGINNLDAIIKSNSDSIRTFSEGVLIGALTGGIEFAGKAIVKFNGALMSTKNFFNFLVDASLASLQSLQEFSMGLVEAVSSVQNFLGLSSTAADGLTESIARSIEITKLARITNDEEAAARIMNHEALAEVVELTTSTINDAIISEAVVKEGTDLRIIQSEKNKQALLKKERDTAEKARIKALQANFLFQKAWDKQTQKEKVASVKGTLGHIATLQASGSKEGFAIGKAAAIADHGINAVSAVSKALGSAPPPFNFILAGLVGAAMAVQGAKIASSSPPAFNNGGVVGGFQGATGGPDNININARRGEMFLNAAQQRNLFDDINRKGSNNSIDSEAILALASQDIVIQIDNKEIARATRDAQRDGFKVTA